MFKKLLVDIIKMAEKQITNIISCANRWKNKIVYVVINSYLTRASLVKLGKYLNGLLVILLGITIFWLFDQFIVDYFSSLKPKVLLLENGAPILQGEYTLILSVIGSFFFYLVTSSRRDFQKNTFIYCEAIIYFFLFYSVFIVIMYYQYRVFNFSTFYCLNGFFQITPETFIIRLGISLGGVWAFLLLQYLMEAKTFTFAIEFPLLLALLHFIFILAVLCSNFFQFV